MPYTDCTYCRGTGSKKTAIIVQCYKCYGIGHRNKDGTKYTCNNCGGTGHHIVTSGGKCCICNGDGKIQVSWDIL